MRRVFQTFVVLWATSTTAAPLQIQFLGRDGQPYGGVVMALRSSDASRPLAKPVPAVMDQIERQFVPHVLVIPVGSRVTFPNSDTVSHQVYSFSPAKSFDLPLYSGKVPPPVTFAREGIVTLGCNIHDQMRAYVYVVQAQYYARADHEGRWSAPDVAPGDYTLTIWHPLSRSQDAVLEQRITVEPDGTTLTLRAQRELKLRRESQVPANWDAY